MFCKACGEAVLDTTVVCPKCGSYTNMPNKNRIVAALLAIFLGGLGIHKFYNGQPIWGILYFLFCWTFIPGIVGFIEGIIYLCISDATYTTKYCR